MAYTKTNWQDLPNTTTPINATNLNKIENELEALDTNTSTISLLGTGSLAIGANNANIILRPNGTESTTGQVYVNPGGNFNVPGGDLNVGGKLVATGGWEQYSTNEIAIGTWVDGKTLYRKCISITLPDNALVNHYTGVLASKVVNAYGTYSNGTSTIPINYLNLLYSGGAFTYLDGYYAYVGCTFDGTGYSGYLILEYTKD